MFTPRTEETRENSQVLMKTVMDLPLVNVPDNWADLRLLWFKLMLICLAKCWLVRSCLPYGRCHLIIFLKSINSFYTIQEISADFEVKSFQWHWLNYIWNSEVINTCTTINHVIGLHKCCCADRSPRLDPTKTMFGIVGFGSPSKIFLTSMKHKFW